VFEKAYKMYVLLREMQTFQHAKFGKYVLLPVQKLSSLEDIIIGAFPARDPVTRYNVIQYVLQAVPGGITGLSH
jgi:hypothetical protein